MIEKARKSREGLEFTRAAPACTAGAAARLLRYLPCFDALATHTICGTCGYG